MKWNYSIWPTFDGFIQGQREVGELDHLSLSFQDDHETIFFPIFFFWGNENQKGFFMAGQPTPPGHVPPKK